MDRLQRLRRTRPHAYNLNDLERAVEPNARQIQEIGWLSAPAPYYFRTPPHLGDPPMIPEDPRRGLDLADTWGYDEQNADPRNMRSVLAVEENHFVDDLNSEFRAASLDPSYMTLASFVERVANMVRVYRSFARNVGRSGVQLVNKVERRNKGDERVRALAQAAREGVRREIDASVRRMSELARSSARDLEEVVKQTETFG